MTARVTLVEAELTKRNLRFIARLDVKREHLVKGIQLEGLRKLGRPNEFARKYYAHGIDEIVYMDIVASLYERNSILPVIERAAEDIFVPLTVGGGIRSLDNVRDALNVGADKVAVNTAALRRPALITEIAETFGAQCMVLSIEAKRRNDGGWEAYFDNGREHSDRDVIEWAQEGAALGAGEILLTSVDREGGQKGMDLDLIRRVSAAVPIPVIASGGVGTLDHVAEAARETPVDAIAMAHVLHYDTVPLPMVKDWARGEETLEVRA